jgi:type I restriction enzyme M protein
MKRLMGDQDNDVFTPPRPLEVIDAELKQVTDRILEMIGGLSG